MDNIVKEDKKTNASEGRNGSQDIPKEVINSLIKDLNVLRMMNKKIHDVIQQEPCGYGFFIKISPCSDDILTEFKSCEQLPIDRQYTPAQKAAYQWLHDIFSSSDNNLVVITYAPPEKPNQLVFLAASRDDNKIDVYSKTYEVKQSLHKLTILLLMSLNFPLVLVGAACLLGFSAIGIAPLLSLAIASALFTVILAGLWNAGNYYVEQWVKETNQKLIKFGEEFICDSNSNSNFSSPEAPLPFLTDRKSSELSQQSGLRAISMFSSCQEPPLSDSKRSELSHQI